jgi:hypothetical protein
VVEAVKTPVAAIEMLTAAMLWALGAVTMATSSKVSRAQCIEVTLPPTSAMPPQSDTSRCRRWASRDHC